MRQSSCLRRFFLFYLLYNTVDPRRGRRSFFKISNRRAVTPVERPSRDLCAFKSRDEKRWADKGVVPVGPCVPCAGITGQRDVRKNPTSGVSKRTCYQNKLPDPGTTGHLLCAIRSLISESRSFHRRRRRTRPDSERK